MIAGWLLDTSAIVRSREPVVLEQLTRLLFDRMLCTCPILELEALAGRGSADLRREISIQRARAYRPVPLGPDVLATAVRLRLRVDSGAGRPPIASARIVVAATAIVHGLGVLHYDAAFARLGEVTGLDQVSVAPFGSLP